MGQSAERIWSRELHDLLRAISGAYLFGMPLLFTMEMWWIGQFAELWKLLVLLGLAFLINLYLAYSTGFKRPDSPPRMVDDATQAMAIGVVTSIVVLFVLNRINFGDPLDSMLGKVVVQAVPLSIGSSIANSIFDPAKKRDEGSRESKERSTARATLRDLAATAAGGIFLGFSIAPTEEIPMLAAEINVWHQLALVPFTFGLSYLIVFESGFGAQQQPRDHQGVFQRPLTETATAYLVSLVVSFVALYLLHQITLDLPVTTVISRVFVLGLPVAIGGAAGRLLS